MHHHGGMVLFAVLAIGVPALLLIGALNRARLIARVRTGFRAGQPGAGKGPARSTARPGRSGGRAANAGAAGQAAGRGATAGVFSEWLRYRHFKGAARIADRLDRRRHNRYMARQAASGGAPGSAAATAAPRSPAGKFGTVRGRVVRTAGPAPAAAPSPKAGPPSPQAPPPAGPPPPPPAAPAAPGPAAPAPPGPPPHYAGHREPHPVHLRGGQSPAPVTAAPAPGRQAVRTDQAPALQPGPSPVPAGGALMSAGAVEQVVDGVHGIYQRAMNGGIRAKHAAIKACAEACVRFALMLEMLSRGFADEKHYGPEITEPIAGAAMHLRAAAMSLSDSDSAIATMLGMSVGELADSPRQAPVHTELSETGAS